MLAKDNDEPESEDKSEQGQHLCTYGILKTVSSNSKTKI